MDGLYTTLAVMGTVSALAIATVMIIMLNTIIHEAGHAVAMVLCTKDKVSVFLGTYGNNEKSRRITLGSFEIWIVKNLFKWRGGLSRPQANDISSAMRFICILAGPCATLLLSLLSLWFLLVLKPEGLIAPFLVIFIVITGLSFISNIIPRNDAIITQNGNLIYNDGSQLMQLLAQGRLPSEFNVATTLFNEKQYVEAFEILEKMINTGTKNPDVYRMAIAANMEMKNYFRADELQKQRIAKIGNLNTHDRMTLALLKTFLGKHDEAIAYYKHLLQSAPNNKYNLNNLGYTLTLVNRYSDAIFYLDKAILIDDKFAYAYCNRAFAKMKLGLLEDGRVDNEISFSLDDSNAYAYRNAGIYFFENGNFEEADKQFEIAWNIDPDTFLLETYIRDTRNRIKEKQ